MQYNKSLLFHKDVFVPKWTEEIVKNLQINFEDYNLSRHILERFNTELDRSHKYFEEQLRKCLEQIKDNYRRAFEIEVSKDSENLGDNEWHVTKYCIRVPLDDKQDMVIAIRPYYNKYIGKYNYYKNLVTTAWLNSKDDAHFTLDKTKYCNEKEWKENE